MVSKSTISTEFVGLEMVSPIILLSGCVGFGDEYSRLEGFSNKVVGGVVLKGTTLEPRLGNTPHRVTETPSGMLNSIGLQNPGVSRVVNDILPGLQPLETQYIANVSGSTVDEYVAVCKAFDRSLVAAIELNISCPNVKKGGMEFGNDPEMSAQVVEACRKTTTKPIITKLSPNQSDIQLNARLCIEAGTDALAVINTITGMMIDIEKRTPVLGNHAGGLSGPAIKPIALKKVYDVYQVSKNHGVPILGQGGVSSAEDAIEFLLAGSSAVGVGTALFFDPLVCNKINKGLEEYLEKNNFNGIDQLIGAAA
jgi:dihydroorotate dehydrogenase (NAD+) catalytic subunit